jgi:hypothetical protein
VGETALRANKEERQLQQISLANFCQRFTQPLAKWTKPLPNRSVVSRHILGRRRRTRHEVAGEDIMTAHGVRRVCGAVFFSRILKWTIIAGAAGCACLVLEPLGADATIAKCNPSDAQAAAPAGMTIADIPDNNPALPPTTNGVADIPAGALGTGSPEVCLVTGSVVTDPTVKKTANFGAILPASWNGKFMFQGCGGNCGEVLQQIPTLNQLNKGYPVWTTDGGHAAAAFTDTWAVTGPGMPNGPALIDFYYRANHTVVEFGKTFTNSFYSGIFTRSYFVGCSDGGRDGMNELALYPEDFDGILAGDPYFDIRGEILDGAAGVLAELRSQTAALTPNQFQLASTTILSQCDGLDGVLDGLIQNPQVCPFNPATDVPKCPGNIPANTCFTSDQINSLSVMLSAITDPAGTVLQPGYPAGDLLTGLSLAAWMLFPTPPSNLTGPEPWNNNPAAEPVSWYFADGDLKYFVYFDQNGYNTVTTPGFSFTSGGPGPLPVSFNNGAPGPITGFHAVLPEATNSRIALTTAPGSAGSDPLQAASFLSENRKLILYHGLADGLITPYRTMNYFKQLAGAHNGYQTLGKNARLFLVPGMTHCSLGDGPNNFGQAYIQAGLLDAQHDALTALEDWVEWGIPPAQIIATKFENDNPTQPVLRTMPLCPFPAKAHYYGSGNILDAANWTCPANDTSMLQSGPDGKEAGIGN